MGNQVNSHVFKVLIQHHIGSYLQPIRTNTQISSISLWRIEPSFFDLLLILKVTKVIVKSHRDQSWVFISKGNSNWSCRLLQLQKMRNLIMINLKLYEKFQRWTPLTTMAEPRTKSWLRVSFISTDFMEYVLKSGFCISYSCSLFFIFLAQHINSREERIKWIIFHYYLKPGHYIT